MITLTNSVQKALIAEDFPMLDKFGKKNIAPTFLSCLTVFYSSGLLAQGLFKEFPFSVPSLNDDLLQLMVSDERIKAAEQNLKSAAAGEEQAFSAFLPKLSFSSDAGREVIDSPSTRTTGLDEQRESRSKATFTLSQNLFSGGADSASYKISGKQVELAELALQNVKSSVVLEGLTTHFSLIRDKKLLDYSEQAENLIKQQLKLENEKVEKGSGIALDILQAKSRLQLASQRKIQFRGQLEQAIARFSYLFKYRPILNGAFQSDFELPEIPAALEEVLSITLKNSPAIQNAQQSAEVSELGLKTARSGYWPRIDLESSYNFERDAGGVEGIRRDWSVLLKASWTLFDGFNTSNGVRAARSSYAAALSQFDATKKQVEADIAIGLQQLKTSTENKDLVANGLKIAEEIVVARERLEKAGKETSINTLDAQSQLIDAKINYTLAYYEQKLIAFNVIFNMGLLSVEK